MPVEPRHESGTDGRAAVPLSPQAELRLVEDYRLGDPEAVERLLRAYERRIYAVCYRMVRREQEARDLAQESMLKILQGLESYDGRAKLSTWVIRVTMNCCLSHLRRQRLRRHASLSGSGEGPPPAGPPTEEPPPDRRVEQREMHRILARALGRIDPDMRAVLVLRDMQDLEYQRIAEVLEVPVGTIKSRLFRARLALRKAVEALLEGKRS